jgi:hypothetical protein
MSSVAHHRRSGAILVAVAGSAVCGLLALLMLAALLLEALAGAGAGDCSATAGSGALALGAPGAGTVVGASEYGGPGDPSSGVLGASGANLLAHPDSYAELGGLSFATATMMGGLAYMTPLRVTWGGHSAIAYKRDFGLGGGPIGGRPRVIDLWWQFAGALGIPYDQGLWSGRVRVTRPPATGAGSILGETASPSAAATAGTATGCLPAVLAVSSGARAQLLPSGLAAAPASAPEAVKAIIAAGNQIVGKPYVYGAAHGLALSVVAPAYDCSSSVEHLLYGARLLAVNFGGPSGELESFGAPGPGTWVTVYASPDHVFMYVAGLRWDTWNAAGPQDGTSGIGWHPLIRGAVGFAARHPVGL